MNASDKNDPRVRLRDMVAAWYARHQDKDFPLHRHTDDALQAFLRNLDDAGDGLVHCLRAWWLFDKPSRHWVRASREAVAVRFNVFWRAEISNDFLCSARQLYAMLRTMATAPELVRDRTALHTVHMFIGPYTNGATIYESSVLMLSTARGYQLATYLDMAP
jgi:predicted esterase